MTSLLETSTVGSAISPVELTLKTPDDAAFQRFTGSSDWRRWLLCGIVGLMLAMLLRSTFVDLFATWQVDPNVSHGPLVVLMSVAMSVSIFRADFHWLLQRTASPNCGKFFVTLALGSLLHAVGWFIGSLLLATVGSVLCLLATAKFWFGPLASKRLAFPIWFLVCAAPLPLAWRQASSQLLQQIASVSAEEGLAILGIPTLRSGNVLQLPGFALEVGEACSGIRQLTAMIALAAGIAYFAGRTAKYRCLLVAMAIPVAIGANCLRAILTGVTLVMAGSAWAEGMAHTLEGVGMAAMGGALLLLLARILKPLDRLPSPDQIPSPSDAASHATSHLPDAASPIMSDLRVASARTWPQTVFFMASLGVAACCQSACERHVNAAGPPSASPLYNTLASLPMELGAWRGEDLPIRDPNWKYADEHFQRVYRHAGSGKAIWVWAAYSATGADRGHHPEICQAVAGKREDTSARSVVELTGDGAAAQEYRFYDEAQAQRVLYWHYTLQSPQDDATDILQRAYRRFRFRPASVTIEMAAADNAAEDQDALRHFAVLLDATIRGQIVGPFAIRGSRRTPVVIVQQ